MTIFRMRLLSSLALIILQACQKDNNEPPTNPAKNCGTLLRMISSLDKGNSTTYFRSFNYNGNARVENFVDSIMFLSDNGGYLGISSDIKRVDYDQDGRITQITERKGPSDSIFQLWFYNAENLIIKNIYISKLEKDTLTDTYSYDDQKRLVIDSFFDNKNKSQAKYTTFRYDTNDNVVEWISYTNGSVDLKAEATYDEHPNPFHFIMLYAIPYYYGDNSGLSRNNIVTVTYSNGTVTQYGYEYKYCSNGWPLSAVLTLEPGRTIVKNIEFDYY